MWRRHLDLDNASQKGKTRCTTEKRRAGTEGRQTREKSKTARHVLTSALSEGHVFLDQLAEALAVFVFHVYKFHAVAMWANVSDDGREVNFA